MQIVRAYKITSVGSQPRCLVETGTCSDKKGIWLAISYASRVDRPEELIVSVELTKGDIKRLINNMLELI